MMRAIGVIPARWASTRFVGKVLAEIQGRPMIQHVWERARQASSLADVLIACDDQRVRQAAEHFGARAVMTSPLHPSGTDRLVEAIQGLWADIVVNIQGDEPLMEPMVINDLVEALSGDRKAQMATAIKATTDPKEIHSPHVVKVVIDANRYALYFSRAAIPYVRDENSQTSVSCWKHIGIYAYRRDFLERIPQLPVSHLERLEKLEQLRVLEAGYCIKTVETSFESIGVDTPEDLQRVQQRLQGGNTHG
jgi:3-deoxy-manno-octulosonate cytidylyltransferase (CMP-KDO synthetase)